MFYTVIKLDGHLKTREKCSPSARDFNISRVFSNVRRVLSQYKTWLSLLYLFVKGFFSQSERALDCIYVIMYNNLVLGFLSGKPVFRCSVHQTCLGMESLSCHSTHAIYDFSLYGYW
jgi:hypothetical protein